MVDQESYVDPIKECLKAVSFFYDIQSDIDGVIGSTARASGRLVPDDIKLLGPRLGLNVQQSKLPFRKLEGLSVPAILVLEGGCCVYFPDGENKARFFWPNSAVGDAVCPGDIAKSYTGRLLLLSPKERKSSIDISHMEKGHALDWFWTPLKTFWPAYAETIFCSVFINVLALAIPLFTLNVYDRVIVNFVEGTLIVLAVGVLFAIIFDFFFKTMRAHILEDVATRVSVRYDSELMERLIHIREVDMPLSTGEKLNLFSELHTIKDFYASRLVPTLVDVPFFILFTFVIYLLAPPLSIIPIVAAVIILIVNLISQLPINRATAKYFTAMQNRSSFLVEALEGLSTAKILGGTGFKLFQWKQVTSSSAQASHYNAIAITMISNLSILITQVGQVSMIFAGAYLVHGGSLTIGGLIASTIIYGRAIGPAVSVSAILARLKRSRDVLETVDKIFQLPFDDAGSMPSAKGPFKGSIEIKDLIFQYPGRSVPALYKINLFIRGGESVGLIGKTGAGKTTLGKMIGGLLAPSQGTLFLDGYIYSSISSSELSRTIGYVPQDPFFFKGSLRQNIVMGEHETDESELERVIRMSGLDLVIQQTGEGLDSEVGENGKNLSGGQRQALALARVLIKNPRILVFDEPTTGMDNALEARVRDSLREFIKSRTLILVTHRTTLLPLLDRLILLDRGSIAIDGTREDVLRKLSDG
ncbi:MAG: ATP-binding cassette domain-containing protein [Verrucomicrobiae bacterium]|nr:ATP-binding cassette domain-containing protein [Verrucomicrobiae bacterium]